MAVNEQVYWLCVICSRFVAFFSVFNVTTLSTSMFGA